MPQTEDFFLGHFLTPGNPPVGDAHTLGSPQSVGSHGFFVQFRLKVHNIAHFFQEEHIDPGRALHQAQIHPPAHQLRQGKHPVIGSHPDIGQQLFGGSMVKFGIVEVADAHLQRADGFQEALLQCPADAHHFAGGFHLGGKPVGGAGELVEGDPGNFGDHIVDGRLKAGRGVGQLNFIQRQAHRHLGGNPGNGEAGGLTGQGGGTGDPGVDFNHIIGEGVGVQRKLNVAAALDFQRPDDPQRAAPQQLIFFIGQRLTGRDHNAVAGVNSDRVHIFHAADGDGGVVLIPHHFKFDFLEALDALLHQNFADRGELQGVFGHFQQLGFVFGKAAAGSSQGKGRPQDHRIADFSGSLLRFFHRMGGNARQNRFAQ